MALDTRDGPFRHDYLSHEALPGGWPERFIDHYTAFDREEMERLAQWDLVNNHSRLFHPWQPLDHPQLGAVEVGGLDACIGIWNPQPEILPAICDGLVNYWRQVASLLPRLVIEAVRCTPLGDGYRELEVTVANHGYLPSHRCRPLANGPGTAAWRPRPSPRAVGCTNPRRVLGHLDGWGRDASAPAAGDASKGRSMRWT